MEYLSQWAKILLYMVWMWTAHHRSIGIGLRELEDDLLLTVWPGDSEDLGRKIPLYL